MTDGAIPGAEGIGVGGLPVRLGPLVLILMVVLVLIRVLILVLILIFVIQVLILISIYLIPEGAWEYDQPERFKIALGSLKLVDCSTLFDHFDL